MQELLLNQSSSLVETVNRLIDIFDDNNPICARRYEEWVSAQNKEQALPDAWRDKLLTDDDNLGYFCVETALSIAFKTVVASNTENETPESFKELEKWHQWTSEQYYSELSESIYAWPFILSENSNDVSVSSGLFSIDSATIEESHDALGDLYHEVFDKTLRKELGEFYTSQRIISYLLDSSDYDEEIWNKRLLDPACGSGSFLISAVRRLLESKPNKFTNGEAVHQICNSPLIVGFDINPFACEIARLRLFLTLYPYLTEDDYRIQKLPIFNIDALSRDDNDIKSNKNQTLAQFSDGGDIREQYVDEVQLQEITSSSYNCDKNTTLNQLLSEYQADPIRPEAKTTHGNLDRVTGRILRDNVHYDTVVGNPPYVRIQKIPEKQRQEYKEGFESATGRFDLSVLFMEYGIESLRDGGHIGFITSNKFLTTGYGQGLRAHLRDNMALDTLIDFTDTDAFDLTVLPCILVAQKGVDRESFGYSILKQADNHKDSEKCDDLLSLIHSHLTDELFEGRYTIGLNGGKETVKLRCFESSLPESKDATWTFIPEKETAIVNKIDQKKTADLGSIAEKISVGIKTTANNVFVDPITDSTIEEYGLEEELLHPAISGKNVSRWSIDWASEDPKKPSYILYPHKIVDGSVKPVDLDQYPNAKAYLENHYEQLAGRSYLKDAGRKWYECWVPQHPDYFDVDNKIITPEMAPGNSFALDTSNFFCIGSCYSILLNDEDPVLYRFITGLLNSDLVEFYLKADSSTQLYADRFRYNKSYIENLPILYTDYSEANMLSANRDSIEEVETLEDVITYVASLVENVQEGEFKPEAAEQEINELIYRVFDITTEEQQTIQRYLTYTSSE